MKTQLIGINATAAVMIFTSCCAGEVDWTRPFAEFVDQSQTDDGYHGWAAFGNFYGWDRAVTMWQEFRAGTSGYLDGIALSFGSAAAGGSVDLNVYAGEGVEGDLLGSTHLHWTNALSSTLWFGFQLDNPVPLTAGSLYTFSLENLSGDANVIHYYVSASTSDPYPSGACMQQGYQMPNGYHAPGGTGRDIAFQTIMDVPEPAGAALASFGMLSLMVRLRRSWS
jgi:hypothetical protein